MKDQLNRTIHLTKIPKRIISLVPSQTELLVDLGLEDSIVGITKFCVHPKHLKKTKTIVGGTKTIHIDKIKALQPDIILCNKEENTQEMIVELEQIAPVHISDIYSIDGCLELMEMYGKLFSKENEAQDVIEKISEKLEGFKTFVSGRRQLKVAYFIWKNPWMVAAKHTFIDAMLHLNAFENYYKDYERYPEITLDAKHPETADVVLLSSEPFPFKETHVEELHSLFPKATILMVDGEAFSWHGSRLLKSFDYFKMLHQDHLILNA